ncbi:MAG: MarR family transcriptional regulator [Pseudonocardiaceae bacterium]|nr:MarR family transcriptional regulator [Pseudonocardiaceae bacterium]
MTAARSRDVTRDHAPACGVPASRLDTADQLTTSLARFMRLIARAKAQLSSGHEGLEHAAFVLVAHLVNEGPRRLTTLAESVLSDPSTVSRQTAGLVRQGLVERQPDPEDGRASLLAATAEGERLYQRARHDRDVYVAQALRHWNQRDIEQFVSLLERLTTDFEAYTHENALAAEHSAAH